jgi:hypothetical protein
MTQKDLVYWLFKHFGPATTRRYASILNDLYPGNKSGIKGKAALIAAYCGTLDKKRYKKLSGHRFEAIAI